MPPVGSRPSNDEENIVNIQSGSIYNWPSDKKLILYFTNWGVYGRNFQVKDIPIDNVTGINYGFYDLKQNTQGNYVPTTGDSWADTDQRYTTADKGLLPLDTWNDNTGFYGNFGQFKKLKDQGKKFNLGLSIGGWSWSGNFSPSVENPQARKAFVDEVISLFKKYPVFNRVDIDWEYISPGTESYGLPENKSTPADAANFIEFMKLMKASLGQNGMGHYEISACTTADPKKMEALPIKEMVQYLDTINIMTYDFSDGAWGVATSSQQSNVYKTPYSSFSVEEAVNKMLSLGVPKNKIVIGAAYYSRGYSNTDGMGKSCSGGSPDMSWEKGIVDYKDLPQAGATEYYDEKAGAGYSYDPVNRVLNSYDTIRSVQEKCKYVLDNNLKGIIVWEASGDRPVSSGKSLTKAMYDSLYNGRSPTPVPQQPTPVPQQPTPVPQQPTPVPQQPTPVPQQPTPIPPPAVLTPGLQEWKPSVLYRLHAKVLHKSSVYRCINAHTSTIGWEPSVVRSLWEPSFTPQQPTPVPQQPTPAPQQPTPVPQQPTPVLNECPYLNNKIKSVTISGDIEISDIKFNY